MNHFYSCPAVPCFLKALLFRGLGVDPELVCESDCPSTAPYYLRLHTCRLLALLWSAWNGFFFQLHKCFRTGVVLKGYSVSEAWLFIQCSDSSTAADPYCCVLLVICVFWLPPSEIAYWWQWLVFRPCQSILHWIRVNWHK